MNKIFSPSLFANRVNIVTGGGTGIGFGVARAIVELGGKCVIASRSFEKIDAAVDQLKPYCTGDAEISGVQVNIKSRESVAKMVSTTLDRYGRLDGLVNNGGGQFVSPGEAISSNGWKAVVETNLYGPWNCMQEAHEQFMAENGGYIVNIVTTNRTGMVGMSHTSAARAGTKSLSQSIGAEWAKKGIVINNIAPGVIHSDSAQANYGPIGEVLFDSSRRMIPMGELGRVYEDCVPPIIFMLSPAVRYTTGQTLDVCGGLSLYNNYLNQYQNMGTWLQDMIDEEK